MRTSKKDEFFEEVKRWSERKHRLLEKYLAPFSAKVGSWAREIYCVDAFAGAATYGDMREGSPLLMARLSDKCASWKSPVTLRLINIEKKPSHYRSLCAATKPWVERDVVKNIKGSFGDKVSEILHEIGHRPALFFLDPYGPTKIYFECIRPILRRPVDATELIINFNSRGLRRLADNLRAKSPRASRRTTEKIVSHVTNIMGSDEWKADFLDDALDSSERETRLLGQYVKTLGTYRYNVVTYPIRETINNAPKYHLIFCSRHAEGVMLMNRFIREEEDQMLDEDVHDRLPLLEVAGARESHRVTADRRILLREYVEEFARGQKITTRKAIKRELIFKNFGMFHENDYTAVVQDMVNEGVLVTGHGKKRFNDLERLTYVSRPTDGT